MNLIAKFLLMVFFNFIAQKVFTINTPEDLIVKVLEESDNKEDTISKNLDLITVNYTGWIFDSNVSTNNHCDAKGEMFDSNIVDTFNHTVPFRFILGKGLVIKGWDLGLQDMRINEQRCLVIPAHLAYGNRRIGNIIKPNSTLIFEVKLLKILKVEK